MLLKVTDQAGVTQTIVASAQEAVVDDSGTIVATGTAQTLLAANVLRSGWVMQNRGVNPMYVNEIATAATAVSANDGSFIVQPGAFFPPVGYPLSTGAVSVLGTIGDAYVVRAW